MLIPKSIFLFLVFQMLLYKANAQEFKKFILKGTVIGRSSGKLYLIYFKENKRTIDSTEVRNEKFVFSGLIDEPTTAELTDNLKLRNESYDNYLSDFYLEQSTMKLSVVNNHFAEAKLNGSNINKEYRLLTGYANPSFEKIFQLQNQMKADSLNASAFSDSFKALHIQLRNYLMDFVKTHSDSYVGVLATQRLFWLKDVSADTILSTFNFLSPRIKNTNAGKKLKASLLNTITSSIGHVAPDFKRKDVNGRFLSLSSLKGNYLLLDFWASWCVPCRVQTSHVKRLYESYAVKGLKVIAISCDSKYDAWQEAIHKDSTELFINILSFTDHDMNFLKQHDNVGEASYEGELRRQFNLMPIPVYILIDPKGVIIGRYGGTEEDSVEMLDKKLIEIFGKG